MRALLADEDRRLFKRVPTFPPRACAFWSSYFLLSFLLRPVTPKIIATAEYAVNLGRKEGSS